MPPRRSDQRDAVPSASAVAGARPFDGASALHAQTINHAQTMPIHSSGSHALLHTGALAYGQTMTMQQRQSGAARSAPWTAHSAHPLASLPAVTSSSSSAPPSNSIQATEQALLSLLAAAGSGGLTLEQQIATVQAMLALEQAKQAEELKRIQMQSQSMQPRLEQSEITVPPKKSRHDASYPTHYPAAASASAASSSAAAVPVPAAAVPSSSSSSSHFAPSLDRPRSVASASNSDGSSETCESHSSSPLVLPSAPNHSRRLLESMHELHIFERWGQQYAAGELSEQAIAANLSAIAANLEETERSELLDAFERMSVGASSENQSAAAPAAPHSGTPPRAAVSAAAAESSSGDAASPRSCSGLSQASSASSTFSSSSFRSLPAVKLNNPSLWVNLQTAAEDDLDGVARLTFSLMMPTHTPAATAAAGTTAAAAAAGHKRKKSNEQESAGAASASTAAVAEDTSMQAASTTAASSTPASDPAALPFDPTPARVVRVNKAWERLTGWTQAEALDQSLRSAHSASMGLVKFLYRSDFVAAALRIGLVCQVEKVSAGQHYLVIRSKSGKDIHVLAGWQVEFLEDGTFRAIIHSYQPLPEGQMPPFVPGVDQTEAQLLWGAHATGKQYDWKAKLTGRG